MNLRIRELAALMLVVLLSPIMMHAQTLKPSYLSEMPAPARILAEIQMARDSDGKRYCWRSRKKRPDVLQQSSGLRFDSLLEK